MAKLEKFSIVGSPTSRAVYVDGFFEKRGIEGVADSTPKYNGFILIPKADKEKMKQLKTHLDAAFEELKGKGFAGKTLKQINEKNNCVVDGDDYADSGDGREAFREYMIVKTASKNFRPIVTDTKRKLITNGYPISGADVEMLSEHELSSGDYVIANISFWTYSQKTFSGIGCNIHAIVRVTEGEQIGGASSDVDDYIDLSQYQVE